MRFRTRWEELVEDNWVLEIVKKGHCLEFTELPPSSGIRDTFATGRRLDVLTKEVEELSSKDAIEVVPLPNEFEGFYCTFFVVPKPGSDKLRPILNLKPLNQFIMHQHFKMESLKLIKKAVLPGFWMASIDL